MIRLIIITDFLFITVLWTSQFSDAKLRKLQAKIDVAMMDIIDFKKELDELRSQLNFTDSMLAELASKQECKCQGSDGNIGSYVDASVSSTKIEQIERHIQYILRGVKHEKLKTDSVINDFMKNMDVITDKLIKRIETETEKQQNDLDHFNEVIDRNEKLFMKNMEVITDKLDNLGTKYEVLSDNFSGLNNTVENLMKRFEKETRQQEDEFGHFNKTIFEEINRVEKAALIVHGSDCYSIKKNKPHLLSGVYWVHLQGIGPLNVFCDMETDGGGWTVFQNRFDGSVDFYRKFEEYIYGFGDINGEFWLGLRYIQTMTEAVRSVLRIDLEAASGKTAYETFDNFFLSDGTQYKLNIDPGVGTAGDKQGLSYNKGFPFSTKDNDRSGYDCLPKDQGGWWYANCAYANLNGEYVTPGTLSSHNNGEGGMTYREFDGKKSLKRSKMMFRQA